MQKDNITAFLFSLLFLLPACSQNSGKVIAKAGQVRITTADLAEEINKSPESVKVFLTTLEGKKQILDILLKEKMLVNAAERSGIVRKAEIQNTLKTYREQKKLEETEFRRGVILKEYLRELRDTELKVEEEEIKNYFDENKEDFTNPIRVTASHILTTTEDEAKSVISRLNKGENFGEVAKEVSKDPSAARGGRIMDNRGEPAPIAKGEMDLPEFEKALFGIKKTGDLSGVVKTKIGYHVIKKTGEMKLPKQTYEDAAPQIHRILERNKFELWIENSKKEQKVWIDEKALASLPIEPDSQDELSNEGETNQ